MPLRGWRPGDARREGGPGMRLVEFGWLTRLYTTRVQGPRWLSRRFHMPHVNCVRASRVAYCFGFHSSRSLRTSLSQAPCLLSIVF